MKKENINMSFSHLLRESRNWIPGTSPRMTLESGRTLLELIMTLAVIGVLGMGAIKFYKHTVNKVKAQNTAKMIKTISFERQNMALRQESGLETTVKGPHSALHVKNGTSGNHPSYFWVETTLSDKDFCDSLKDSGFIQAEFVEVDGVRDGNCRDNSKLAFYFKKNPNAQVYCPSHSTNCDTYGDATGCEEGYYLAGGVCESCGEHVATCEDENTPTSCEEGYELLGGSCIEPKICTSDSQCSVCGECDSETGYCKGECSIPEPDANNDCGENECIVYDDTTQTCQNKCERKEYLESTGTQWIDTDVVFKITDEVYFKGALLNLVTDKFCITASTWNNNNNRFSMLGWYSGKLGVAFGSLGTPNTHFTPIQNDTDVHIVTYKNKVFTMEDTSAIYDGSSGIWGVDTTYLKLFYGYNSATACKIYRYLQKRDGYPIRDFIPVLSPTGQPAMFDKVTQKLFYNAGTGEFLTD